MGKMAKEKKSGFRAAPITASPSLPTLSPQPYVDPLSCSTLSPSPRLSCIQEKIGLNSRSL